MNKTSINHGLVAGIITLVMSPINPYFGAVFIIGFYLGREHAQVEYKHFKYGTKNTLKPWQGFQGWSQDNLLDFIVPTVTALVVAVCLRVVFPPG